MATDPAPHDLERIVGQLRRVPISARRFSATPEEALTRYGIKQDLLDAVKAAGLPHVTNGELALYDDYDLTNLSLYLRLRSPVRAAMRYWAGVLTRPEGERRNYQIDYLPACPMPGHLGDCEFFCCTPNDGELITHGQGNGTTVVASVPVELHNDWPALPDQFVRLVDEISDVRFFRLPDGIKQDLDFMLAERIGDCMGIALHLASQGEEVGLETRAVFGLIIAPPYSTPHFWAEVKVDNRWVPADPGLINGMTDWGVLAAPWPASKSPGAFLVPLTSRHGFAVSHGGIATGTSFRTRVL